MTDLTAIKALQQQMWASGDFAMVGTTIYITSELLCEAVAGLLRADAAGLRRARPRRTAEARARSPDLARRMNRPGETTMVVPSDYLEVVAVRR